MAPGDLPDPLHRRGRPHPRGHDRPEEPAAGEPLAPPAPVDREALAAVVDAFAATVTGPFTAREVLALLARSVTEVLAVEGAGVMVAADGALLRFVDAHGRLDRSVAELEQLQEVLQDGPCRDSHLQERLVNLGDIAVEGSWPTYQRRAAAVGLRAVTAVPLRARGRSWGVLDLYRSSPRRLDAAELAAARTLANLATSYLVVAADREAAEQARAAAEQARAAAEQAQADLAHQAMHDPLTGLPVRWVLLEQAGHALARLARHHGRVGVLFIDLDGLKYVNDTHGHAAGDDLLTTCAERIRGALRPSDLLARVGGDEFVVLVEDLPARAGAAPDTAGGDAGGATDVAAGVADRVLAALAAPHRVDGHVLTPSASIGLAVTDDPRARPAALIAHADSAMYRAKRAGRGRVESFDAAGYESDRVEATTPDLLLPALRTGLAEGQLELHYQPVLDMGAPGGPLAPGEGDGGGAAGAAPRVHAVEALVRWHRPGHGVVPAAAFITAAERAGLITDLGAWVLGAACAQLAAWDDDLGDGAPRQLLVNIGATELAEPDLAARVRTCLDEHGLDPDRLVLEVTETAVLTDHAAAASTVAQLQHLGVALAIDDFGTGCSSLSRLVTLPASTLKVDRSFTRDLLTSPAARAVVTAVLQLGHALGRTVVVEGVEDAPTQQALVALGARYLQGYHLARPCPAADLSAALSSSRGR